SLGGLLLSREVFSRLRDVAARNVSLRPLRHARSRLHLRRSPQYLRFVNPTSQARPPPSTTGPANRAVPRCTARSTPRRPTPAGRGSSLPPRGRAASLPTPCGRSPPHMSQLKTGQVGPRQYLRGWKLLESGDVLGITACASPGAPAKPAPKSRATNRSRIPES